MDSTNGSGWASYVVDKIWRRGKLDVKLKPKAKNEERERERERSQNHEGSETARTTYPYPKTKSHAFTFRYQTANTPSDTCGSRSGGDTPHVTRMWPLFLPYRFSSILQTGLRNSINPDILPPLSSCPPAKGPTSSPRLMLTCHSSIFINIT